MCSAGAPVSVQQGLEAKRRNIPDAYLFLDEADRRRPTTKEQEDKVRHADLILEAKRWNVPFDTQLRPRDAADGAAPRLSVARRDAVGPAGALGHSHRRPQMAALLPGREVAPDGFSAKSTSPVALGVAGVEPDLFTPKNQEERDHGSRLFLLFFRAESFRPEPTAARFHQLALDEGRYWEARVKRDLSDTIFDSVFPGSDPRAEGRRSGSARAVDRRLSGRACARRLSPSSTGCCSRSTPRIATCCRAPIRTMTTMACRSACATTSPTRIDQPDRLSDKRATITISV